MSTSNTEVFNRFLSLIEDDKLCSLLTDEELTYHLEYFLNESLSVYFKNCKKDLTLREKADFYRQSETATPAQTDFLLTQYPNDPNSEAISYVCTVDSVDATYTFDALTQTFTISSPVLSGGETVEVGYDFVGQFNEDSQEGELDDEELWILAHGMVVTWNSAKVYSEKNLKNKLSTTDYKQFSPANLIDKLLAIRNQSLKEIRRLTVSYSFNGFTGFN